MKAKTVKPLSLRAALDKARDRVLMSRSRTNLDLWDLTVKTYPQGDQVTYENLSYGPVLSLKVKHILKISLQLLGLPEEKYATIEQEITQTQGTLPKRLSDLAFKHGLNTYEPPRRPFNIRSSKAGGTHA